MTIEAAESLTSRIIQNLNDEAVSFDEIQELLKPLTSSLNELQWQHIQSEFHESWTQFIESISVRDGPIHSISQKVVTLANSFHEENVRRQQQEQEDILRLDAQEKQKAADAAVAALAEQQQKSLDAPTNPPQVSQRPSVSQTQTTSNSQGEQQHQPSSHTISNPKLAEGNGTAKSTEDLSENPKKKSGFGLKSMLNSLTKGRAPKPKKTDGAAGESMTENLSTSSGNIMVAEPEGITSSQEIKEAPPAEIISSESSPLEGRDVSVDREEVPEEDVAAPVKKYVPTNAMSAMASAMRAGLSNNNLADGQAFSPSKVRLNSVGDISSLAKADDSVSPLPLRPSLTTKRPETVYVVESTTTSPSPPMPTKPRPTTMVEEHTTTTTTAAPLPTTNPRPPPLASKPRPPSRAGSEASQPPMPASRPTSLATELNFNQGEQQAPIPPSRQAKPVRTHSQVLDDVPITPVDKTRPMTFHEGDSSIAADQQISGPTPPILPVRMASQKIPPPVAPRATPIKSADHSMERPLSSHSLLSDSASPLPPPHVHPRIDVPLTTPLSSTNVGSLSSALKDKDIILGGGGTPLDRQASGSSNDAGKPIVAESSIDHIEPIRSKEEEARYQLTLKAQRSGGSPTKQRITQVPLGPALQFKKKEFSISGDDKALEKRALEWLNLKLADKGDQVVDLSNWERKDLDLIYAIEAASGQSVGKYNKRAMLPVHRLDNITVALQFLSKNGVSIQEHSPQEILDGNKYKIMSLLNEIMKKYP